MIKKTVTKNEFIRDFQNTRPDHFTIDGLECIFEMLQDLSDDIGKDIEFNNKHRENQMLKRVKEEKARKQRPEKPVQPQTEQSNLQVNNSTKNNIVMDDMSTKTDDNSFRTFAP